MNIDPCDLPLTCKNDLARLVCGKFLSSGISRVVYEYTLDPTKVVKIETSAGFFQNVLEWEVWQNVRDTRWAKWFAPVHYISDNGSVLIQSRTVPAQKRDIPKQLPDFFTDLKLENFGLLDGRFVAHDYGFNLLLFNGLTRGRMKSFSEKEWT